MSRKGPDRPRGRIASGLTGQIFPIFIFHKKSPGEIHSPGLIPATGQPAASGLPLAGGLAGRRPIIGGRLIITLLGLIIPLLLGRLIIPLRLRLIGGLRLPVGCSGHATPGSPEQTADSRPPPGIVVIDGGPQAGPQGRTQTRTRVKARGFDSVWRIPSANSSPANLTIIHCFPRRRPQKLCFAVHDSSLPKGLIGPFKYLEPPQGKMLRRLSLGEKK